ITDEIKKLLGSDRLIIGTALTVKQLKQGTVESVFVTNNCPPSVQQNLQHYAKIAGATVLSAGVENDELGILCKRRHGVSVLGVKKAK
ncbi:MAG TPA: ribosomal L7Ae/L30e/S12e/Gadd45 family protein, partial [Candidatus Nanoarchaeia archaeon]|nr:ribosomal L7Ae/L30e/S12e/Gadd45 family protein [Candidatus Nanoarchaeia archaeon]